MFTQVKGPHVSLLAKSSVVAPQPQKNDFPGKSSTGCLL